MSGNYELRINSPAGVQLERLVGMSGAGDDDNSGAGFLALSYTRGINEIGFGAFTINADSDALDALELNGEPILDTQVEIWRRDDDEEIDAYCDFYGFLRDREYNTDENGITTYTAILQEQSDLLRRATVAWRANTNNRSLFDAVAAETIIKTLVTYNATTTATAGNGRDRTADTWASFISVAADGASGTAQTIACEDLILFDVLREVGEASGLDVVFTKTGARAWQFDVAAEDADDRSASVVFSLLHGNMRRPSLRSNRRAERTVALVAGQGQDNNRVIATRTGANYDATVNSYEMFVNASDQNTAAGLNSAGDVRLEQVRARDAINFDVIQVPSTLYGKHYFLGSVVSARYRGKSYMPRIRRVTVDVQARGGTTNVEGVTVELGDA